MSCPKDPTKIEEWHRKMSEVRTGKHPTIETRIKMSESRRGIKNPCFGRTGERAPMYGKRHSEETKQKMSESQKGKIISVETRLKLSEVNKGKFVGEKHPNYGKRPSEETCKKISAANKGKYRHPLSEGARLKMGETKIGGFWYGNVRYYGGPQYCEKFNADLKERVRAYRGHVCFECGLPQSLNISVKGKSIKLPVHHVHYNKKTCCDGSPHDLVPLCSGCHAKTNTNRDYWEDHFTELIYAMDPEGKCFFTKDEMIKHIKRSD